MKRLVTVEMNSVYIVWHREKQIVWGIIPQTMTITRCISLDGIVTLYDMYSAAETGFDLTPETDIISFITLEYKTVVDHSRLCPRRDLYRNYL